MASNGDENIDNRKIPRGKCTIAGCKCTGYRRVGGAKCHRCNHVPGKHVNLNMNTCKCCEMNTSTGFEYCSPLCRDNDLGLGFNDDEISMLEKSIRDHPIQLKECLVKDCHQPAFCDYQLEFLYCSPACRDRDILSKCQKKLLEDIKAMEESIPKVTMATGIESSVDPIPKVKSSQPNKKTSHQSQATGQTSAGTAVSSTSKNKQRKPDNQDVEKNVTFLKQPGTDHGLIVCEVAWGQSNAQLLITGIKVNKSLACYKMMQSGQLRLFDKIHKVNGVEISITKNSLQETLDDLLLNEREVTLGIIRPHYALQTTCKILSVVSQINGTPTHIVGVVRPSYYEKMKDCIQFGMDISEGKVLSVELQNETSADEEKWSSAKLCGLRTNDKYLASCEGSDQEKDVTESALKRSKKEGIQEHWDNVMAKTDLIVAIVRS